MARPTMANAIKQFYSDVIFGELDYQVPLLDKIPPDPDVARIV